MGKKEIIEHRFVCHGKNFDAAMTFTDEASERILAYINYGLTDTGPHSTGLKTMLTRLLNSWGKAQGILRPQDKNLDGSSLQEGLVFALSLVSKNVSYNAQTKEKVVKCDTSFLDELSTQLEVWLDNNPEDGRKIIEKAKGFVQERQGLQAAYKTYRLLDKRQVRCRAPGLRRRLRSKRIGCGKGLGISGSLWSTWQDAFGS